MIYSLKPVFFFCFFWGWFSTIYINSIIYLKNFPANFLHNHYSFVLLKEYSVFTFPLSPFVPKTIPQISTVGGMDLCSCGPISLDDHNTWQTPVAPLQKLFMSLTVHCSCPSQKDGLHMVFSSQFPLENAATSWSAAASNYYPLVNKQGTGNGAGFCNKLFFWAINVAFFLSATVRFSSAFWAV